MSTFFAVLKANFLRLRPRIGSILVFTVFTLISIAFSVYITGLQEVKAHIALVSSETVNVSELESGQLKVTVVSQRPPLSSLVMNRYDAVVERSENGSYQIQTLRNEKFQQMLATLLEHPNADVSSASPARGIGVNILGFMMMFLLMIVFYAQFAFAEDKEKGQLSRIAAAPISFGWYLAAQYAFSLILLLPEYAMLAIMKLLGWDIGLTLAQYAGLLLALAMLGISFALLLNTLFKKPDNASMFGNSVTILTSLLAGCFYSFSKDNVVMDKIVRVIPQKMLLDFTAHVQAGNAAEHPLEIIYVVGFALALFVITYGLLRRIYVKRESFSRMTFRLALQK